ncbi:hypothetical protein BDV96DRAFT_607785 [Lophiotrema nucula]|uniref:Uncharacterized protein n=1 Tax=Lophiotrema nucula TaxID=690887 RepID=A0A6A5YIG5_9PLEO|nr:hypothetical protein BDV96DRAFT_607785 [Lophiotrema nucula]
MPPVSPADMAKINDTDPLIRDFKIKAVLAYGRPEAKSYCAIVEAMKHMNNAIANHAAMISSLHPQVSEIAMNSHPTERDKTLIRSALETSIANLQGFDMALQKWKEDLATGAQLDKHGGSVEALDAWIEEDGKKYMEMITEQNAKWFTGLKEMLPRDIGERLGERLQSHIAFQRNNMPDLAERMSKWDKTETRAEKGESRTAETEGNKGTGRLKGKARKGAKRNGQSGGA